MAASQSYEDKILGLWKIQECQIMADDREGSFESAVGIKFVLNENRTITWKCSKDEFPLADCDVFELRLSSYAVTMEWAAFSGHTLKFTVDLISSAEAIFSSQLISLKCVKNSAENQDCYDFAYTLLPALDEGFFSDMEVLSQGKQKCQVHQTILSLGLPELDWFSSVPVPEFPTDVLSTLLHFSYSHSLPPTTTTSAAENCLQVLDRVPGTEKLLQKCQLFLKNSSLNSEILELVHQIRASMEKMITFLDTSHNSSDVFSRTTFLWQSVKQGVGEFLVALSRMIQLSCTFMERKDELDVEERVKILNYFRSQVPVLVSQLYRLIKRLRNVINALSPTEKTELANVIVPEVEGHLSTLSAICIEVKNIMERLILLQTERQEQIPDIMKPFHKKRIYKLKKVHDKLTLAVMFLLHKKDTFAELGTPSQTRSIMRNMEFVMEEVPLVVLRLEEIMTSLEDSFSAAESQLIFTQLFSKLACAVSYARDLSNEPNVRALIQQICDLVQRDEFNCAVAALGLIEQPVCTGTPASGSGPFADTRRDELHVIDSQCKPPKASQSELAKRALLLLESGDNADMEFELPTETEAANSQGHGQGQGHVFRGHRVIVAARCRWFRRALLSGMREAIDRKITLPDCSAALLKIFLQFIYGGVFRAAELSLESLTDLLILADRYEVEDLSSCCQTALATRLDPTNVLCLLSVADQWGATQLQDACFTYIAANADTIDKETLEDMAADLRLQVQSCINGASGTSWRSSSSWVNTTRDRYWQPKGADSSDGDSSSDKESVDLFRELTDEMQSAVEQAEQQNREEHLERCIADLVEVLGNHIPRAELVRLAWAADFDVNRAVNFFLSQPRAREESDEN